ncbi:hypothetical protein FRC06_000544 [Ceratobasidium sp. 370]|nr:hypothetical protein FRC06_000544 [Ceratobasidium sp. 370]
MKKPIPGLVAMQGQHPQQQMRTPSQPPAFPQQYNPASGFQPNYPAASPTNTFGPQNNGANFPAAPGQNPTQHIEDPLCLGVKEAIQKCLRAGVTIKMCTGDNVLTACSITSQCGIFMAGGIIMEGPAFRRLSVEAQHKIVPLLQVLARSPPKDKCILVDTLKSLGKIVGVTGNSTNNGPVLKHINVEFSMGIAGMEIAQASPSRFQL